MDLEFFTQPYQALLQDMDRRIAGVSGTMGAGNAGLTAPIQALREQLRRQAEDLMQQGKLLMIGVMGQIKSGKSTFVNALLFDGKPVLPRGATPKTANLTVITYGEEDLLRVTFYSQEEWRQLTEAAEHGNPSVALPARELLTMARSVGGGDDCIGAPDRVIRFSDPASLERQLGQYVGEAGVLTPFIKYVQLELQDPRLKGLAIVDTPGLNDRVYSRVRQTKAYMEKCDVVFYLSSAPDFMDTVDTQLLFQQLPEQGVARLVLIGSKYDSALMDAIWDKGSLAAADADSRIRLNRQADAVVQYFMESTGSNKLAEMVQNCLPPMFVSSIVDGMVGRTYFQYTDEERRVYDGLAPEGAMDDEQMRQIANFDAVRALYEQIAQEKREMLQQKGIQLLRAARLALRRELMQLDAKLAARVRAMEGPDNFSIFRLRTACEAGQQQLAKGFAAVFEEMHTRLQAKSAEICGLLSAIAAEGCSVHPHRSIRSVTHREWVSAAKWYLPWTWGKKREEKWVEQEVYYYYAVEEACDRLKEFAKENAALVGRHLQSAMAVDQVQRELLEHALLVLGASDENLDPTYMRILAQESIEKLTLPLPKADVRAAVQSLAERFGKEAEGKEDMALLEAQLAESVAQLHNVLREAVERQEKQVGESIQALTTQLLDGMTASIRSELQEVETRMQNRKTYAAQIQTAREYLDTADLLAEPVNEQH